MKNPLIRTVKVGQKELKLDDDTYRALLERVTGKRSAADCSTAELRAVIEEMRTKGFALKPRGAKRARARRPLDAQPLSTKIRALWLNLYHMGELDDASEAALGAFAKRTVGVEALQWLNEAQADRVIKALRGWLARIGYVEPDVKRELDINDRRALAGLAPFSHGQCCKAVLILRQQQLLRGLAGDAAPTPPEAMDVDLLDQRVARLGAIIRRAKGKG